MKKKKAIMLLSTIGIIIISVIVYLVVARKARENEVREVSPILEYVKDVMTGNALMEEGMEALEVYRDTAVNIQNAKITFEIEKIELDEKNKKGYIVVEYRISDWGDGRAKWTVEKDSGKWKVVDVYDRPDGYIPEQELK